MCKKEEEGQKGVLTTRSDYRDTLGKERIHHGFKKRKLSQDCMREEVRIDEDRVWGHERSVVLEEERRGNLGNFANHCIRSLLLFVDVALVLTQKSRISLADDTFNGAEFSSPFGNTHDCIVGGGMLVGLAANNCLCQVACEDEDLRFVLNFRVCASARASACAVPLILSRAYTT